MNGFRWLAAAVLIVHLSFILWVIFGGLLTRGRRWFAGVHIASLFYAITLELAQWECPLTAVEQEFLRRAGAEAYEGDFLIHYLEAVIYPDIPFEWLRWSAVAVCLFNLWIYARRAKAG
ncbi:MAG: DUF2784 domain-containing protein [Acidimicrobiia bacterium]|nr:DUF2784 domain-containing protein [Acidimicrobiia bacterium]